MKKPKNNAAAIALRCEEVRRKPVQVAYCVHYNRVLTDKRMRRYRQRGMDCLERMCQHFRWLDEDIERPPSFVDLVDGGKQNLKLC